MNALVAKVGSALLLSCTPVHAFQTKASTGPIDAMSGRPTETAATRPNGETFGNPIEGGGAQTRDGPRILHHALTEPGLVTIRISTPIPATPLAASASELHLELTRRRLEQEAAELGASATVQRMPGHATYTLTGAAADFTTLIESLRHALAEPAPSARELREAQLSARSHTLAVMETPAARVRQALRDALFAVSGVSANRSVAVGTNDLRAYWQTAFEPARMTVVVVGRVSRREVEAAFRDWPRPARRGGTNRSAPAPVEMPTPEVVLPWAALGYTAAELDAAVLAVAADLVAKRLESEAIRDGAAELWWADGQRALVVLGSRAESGAVDALVDALRAAVARTAEETGASEVAVARRALANRLDFASRTTEGLARLIGEFHERSGDADGLRRFRSALDRVDAARVQAALETLLSRTPTIVEVVP